MKMRRERCANRNAVVDSCCVQWNVMMNSCHDRLTVSKCCSLRPVITQ